MPRQRQRAFYGRPAPEEAGPSFTIVKHRERQVVSAAGGLTLLSFTAAVGDFNRKFARNIRVDYDPEPARLRLQIALDPRMPHFGKIKLDANVAESVHRTRIEKMRHTLMDYNEVPPDKEVPLISFMSTTIMGHTIDRINLFEEEDAAIIATIGPVYTRRIRQQEENLHQRIYEAARAGGEIDLSPHAART